MEAEESLSRRNEFDANLIYGVRAFNQATGRDKHLTARKRVETSDALIDPATGRVRTELTRGRVCPLCGWSVATELFVKGGFPHVRCDACRMVYVSPAMREERLHSIYQDEDSYTRVLVNETQRVMDRKRFEYGLDIIEPAAPGRRDLLDVGCGPGTFLEVARARGWSVTGIEWNRWCVQRLRGLGIEVVESALHESGLRPGSMTCVTAWSVLEHVLNPRQFLADVRGVLCDGGVLALMVPNIESLLVRILHEHAATFCGTMHVNFFGPSTLQMMLEQTGYEVVRCETFLTELGTINNFLAFEDPYFGDAASLIEEVTPAWIHHRKMGSQLFAVARARRASSGETT